MSIQKVILAILIAFAFVAAHSEASTANSVCEISQGQVHGEFTVIIMEGVLGPCLANLTKALSSTSQNATVYVLMDAVTVDGSESLDKRIKETSGPIEFFISNTFLKSTDFTSFIEKNSIDFKINNRNVFSGKNGPRKVLIHLVDKESLLQVF